MHRTIIATRTAGRTSTIAGWLTLASTLVAGSSAASDFGLKLEPGFAIPLTAPQSREFGIGVGQTLRGYIGLTPYLDIGPTGTFLMLPSEKRHQEPGVAWGLGMALRLKRPHDAVTALGISPWFDAAALLIRTGDLNRPGFDLALGVSVPIGDTRALWVGPYVRYSHVVQLSRSGFDNRDAKILTMGISFEAGSGIARKPAPPAVRLVYVRPDEFHSVTRYQETRTVTNDAGGCPDRDRDGVVDSTDNCPEVVGSAGNWGCPEYAKIIVRRDKLELKEKLFFAWDQATLEEASFPVLDEVAQALKDNKNFRVAVEGHADSSGADDHNQTLSEQRAATVLDYLVAHGVAKSRLVSKGFSSSVPLDTNTTAAGRENNRRVQFVVHFLLLDDGEDK